MAGREPVVVCLLALAALLSALAVAVVRHHARTEFIESQRLLYERDELRVEWERLQLERGAFQTHGHVEMLAREKLGMEYPKQVATVAAP